MQQEEALTILKMGHSAFVTGSAGSGKTYLLNQFTRWLRKHGVPYAVTAATGVAATHIGGQTIHSWSGLGIKTELTEHDLDALEQKRHLYGRWNDTAVLIIDEVSMLSAEQLDSLSHIGKALRRSTKPFGGIMVVFSGDFYQLPPIAREGEEARFAYESDTWKELQPIACYLESRHRHADDEVFANMLNTIREGRNLKTVEQTLEARRISRGSVPEGITRLYSHNKDVDAENEAHLAKLDGDEEIYEMQSKGRKRLVESLKRGCLAPETLRLKVGAEVMFVKNDPGGAYVNGTRGVIIDLDDTYPIVETRNGRTVVAEPVSWRIEEQGIARAEIIQVPLRLAWALTVHKSQGLTLDEAYMDLSRVFVPGQGYVALSRVRTLGGLHIGGVNSMALTVSDEVRAAERELKERSKQAQARLAQLTKENVVKHHKTFIDVYGGVVKEKEEKSPSHHITADMLKKERSFEEIAEERDITVGTVVGHVEKLLDEGEQVSLSHIKQAASDEVLEIVREAAEQHGWEKLAPLRREAQKSGTHISYDTLRRVRLLEQAFKSYK